MKIVTFGALILFLTEIRADLSNQPSKIQILVKKLFNLKPDSNIAHSLGKPLKLNLEEEQIQIESHEFSDANVKYNFPANITLSKIDSDVRKPKQYYTSLICDFHQQLKICQSIDPPDIEIKGIYELVKTPEQRNKPVESFLIKQYEGRMIYEIFSNGTKDIDIVYKDQEMKFGETSKNHILIVRAIGGIITDVNNQTVAELSRNYNLAKKVQDFEHIFPFLSGSLLPINKTVLKSEEENRYSINTTKIQRWENMYWSLPYVEIRGLNNFKLAKLTAYNDEEGVRFNMTLSTNKLKGYFEWQFGKNKSVMISKSMQNFTIDNLTLTTNTRFYKEWIVDDVRPDLGSITLLKAQSQESYPDINELAYQIFLDNLDMLIKEHLKQLIHEEYSQSGKSEASEKFENKNTSSIRNLANNTAKITTDGILRINLLNSTTITLPNNTKPCKDDRRWWQKIYRSNKCKEMEKLIAQQKPELEKCVDTRWWFQKPFVRNKCKPKKN